MNETLTPVDVLTARVKEWRDLPDGAWKKDLEVMEGLKMLPVTMASLYQDLALVPGESTGSQNRLLLATAATLTQTRNPEIWANKEIAGKIMETVKAAIGEGYDDLLDQWDKAKADNYSLLKATGIVFNHMKETGEIEALTWVEKDELSLVLQEKVVELEGKLREKEKAPDEQKKDFEMVIQLSVVRLMADDLLKGMKGDQILQDLKTEIGEKEIQKLGKVRQMLEEIQKRDSLRVEAEDNIKAANQRAGMAEVKKSQYEAAMKDLPLIEKMAVILKLNKEFYGELKEADLTKVIAGILQLPDLSMLGEDIESEQIFNTGVGGGSIKINTSVGKTEDRKFSGLKTLFELGSRSDDTLLTKGKVEFDASLPGPIKMLLKKQLDKVEHDVRQRLANPQISLHAFLATELKRRGVELETVTAHIDQGKMSLTVKRK